MSNNISSKQLPFAADLKQCCSVPIFGLGQDSVLGPGGSTRVGSEDSPQDPTKDQGPSRGWIELAKGS
jgi:hypothetical protein